MYNYVYKVFDKSTIKSDLMSRTPRPHLDVPVTATMSGSPLARTPSDQSIGEVRRCWVASGPGRLPSLLAIFSRLGRIRIDRPSHLVPPGQIKLVFAPRTWKLAVITRWCVTSIRARTGSNKIELHPGSRVSADSICPGIWVSLCFVFVP